MRLTREDLEPHLFLLQGTRVLLVQLEILTETVVYAIREARKADVTTILNPAPARPLPPDVYPLVECITPNQAEATALSGIRVTGIPSARAAAAWFRDRGCQTVIITLAAAGAVLATQEGAWHIPAFSVYAVDSTAAGDAFNGVLATGLAQDKSPEEAVRWASAAAALTCTRRGAQESLPDLAAIEAFLATHPAPAPIALS
jgi:ribokinase